MEIDEVQEILAVACDKGNMRKVEAIHPDLMDAIVQILAYREPQED